MNADSDIDMDQVVVNFVLNVVGRSNPAELAAFRHLVDLATQRGYRAVPLLEQAHRKGLSVRATISLLRPELRRNVS
jgi:hypothetical protein